MKFLLLLVILGLSGAKGIHLPQQDEAEPPKPEVRESIKNVILHSFVFGVELFSSDPSEKDAQLVLNKRVLSFLKSIYDVGDGIVRYVHETYKEVDEDITKKYPVYRKSIVPIVVQFFSNMTNTLYDLKDDIKPYYDQLSAKIVKQDVSLFNKVKSILLKDEKNWMSLPAVRKLTTSLEPFKEEIRRELEEAKVQVHSELSKTDKSLIDIVSKYTEAVRQLICGEEELDKILDDLQIPSDIA